MHQGCIVTALDAGNELEKGCEKIINFCVKRNIFIFKPKRM